MSELFTKACHGNEWTVLQHIHRHDPDLCPRPVRFTADPPTVTMTVIPGTAELQAQRLIELLS